jgi:hypothetical protein
MRQAVGPLPSCGTEGTAHAPHPAAQRPGKGKLVLNDRHGFPFGLKARLRGGSCSRQSSAIAGNVHFPLDWRAGFRGGSCRQTKIFPALPDERPAPKAGCFVSGLDSLQIRRSHSAPRAW